jgi:hypothetical protein
MAYEYGELGWNDGDRKNKKKTGEKTCPSVNLSATNPAWTDPDTIPAFRGKRSATNSNGRAFHTDLQLQDKYTERLCNQQTSIAVSTT